MNNYKILYYHQKSHMHIIMYNIEDFMTFSFIHRALMFTSRFINYFNFFDIHFEGLKNVGNNNEHVHCQNLLIL